MNARTPQTGTWHRPLLWFSGVMIGLAALSLVGYLVDGRNLVGAPIWAKPLKFSISFVLYATTLAWMHSLVPGGRMSRISWWAGALMAVASALEMTAIVVQVVRGQQSHFNISTPFNRAVFAAMGGLVAVIFTALLTIAVVLVRASPTVDRAVTWSVRLGLGLCVAGLSVGFLMLRPTVAQATLGSHAALHGAHAVGVADGGPGIAFLGWSTTGGDLRVPHFVGLHALQALPLFALALTLIPGVARLGQRVRTQLVCLGACAYAGVFVLVLWQALRGQPVTAPDRTTLGAVAVLIVLVGGGTLVIARGARRSPPPGDGSAPQVGPPGSGRIRLPAAELQA